MLLKVIPTKTDLKDLYEVYQSFKEIDKIKRKGFHNRYTYKEKYKGNEEELKLSEFGILIIKVDSFDKLKEITLINNFLFIESYSINDVNLLKNIKVYDITLGKANITKDIFLSNSNIHTLSIQIDNYYKHNFYSRMIHDIYISLRTILKDYNIIAKKVEIRMAFFPYIINIEIEEFNSKINKYRNIKYSCIRIGLIGDLNIEIINEYLNTSYKFHSKKLQY